ncbi:hypothetical protein MJO28_011977 [Puccinia striiformis f. sp. tritici]|uniref:P-type domain-containing protein n=2 Tax=Puccinia striiformis f. sp. tritici TaxID=168172 RepID=A0A0L0VD83_9BASI|nr:hypothetical protein Pst134EA_023178 [Puccinia striiformis f. sp. tritici]KNE97248.1 hypothetical protein PSTG_09511 [Puccinia striiformis f. sp. tritici PST-78]KAH9446179.1 hypothetical protein Pst134EB_023996 [Puccinia striiformis f. sp. tritici]KAH9455726.1 hypothetical protein Pst134EA_023178 [Puccinia striiformis f. sp. tritici]KAI7941950.1 hypothetical protein MJO28_011977 [Puccinia striiformis f. sp. tritici]KAI7946130.1 hypothetical protein MJO29_012518 [Puccinia striiformis f. sp. 
MDMYFNVLVRLALLGLFTTLYGVPEVAACGGQTSVAACFSGNAYVDPTNCSGIAMCCGADPRGNPPPNPRPACISA